MGVSGWVDRPVKAGVGEVTDVYLCVLHAARSLSPACVCSCVVS